MKQPMWYIDSGPDMYEIMGQIICSSRRLLEILLDVYSCVSNKSPGRLILFWNFFFIQDALLETARLLKFQILCLIATPHLFFSKNFSYTMS